MPTAPARRPPRMERGDLVDSTLGLISFVFPDGTTDADRVRGIGSGPFRLAADEAGAGTRLVRNDEYWDAAARRGGDRRDHRRHRAAQRGETKA